MRRVTSSPGVADRGFQPKIRGGGDLLQLVLERRDESRSDCRRRRREPTGRVPSLGVQPASLVASSTTSVATVRARERDFELVELAR
jgi:hypothetical protein